MANTDAVGFRNAAAGFTAATATTLGAVLDSTTKCAYAAWLRIPPGISVFGGIMFHGDTVAKGNGTEFKTISGDGFQLDTFNAAVRTQLAAPRALGFGRMVRDGRWRHIMVVADSVAGKAHWYVNGVWIGISTTACVAWTVGGSNRTTGLGCLFASGSNVDMYDVRHWAQGDADICIASGPSIAKLAMLGRPAGESARYLTQGPNGVDMSGRLRDLTWAGTIANGVMGTVTGPKVTPEFLHMRRRLRVGRHPVAVLFHPYFLQF